MDYREGLPLYLYPKVMRAAKNRLLNDGNSRATKLFEFIWPEDVFQVDTLYRPEEIGAPTVGLSKKSKMASAVHQRCDSCAVLSVNNRIRFKGYDYVVVHVEVHPSYSTCDVYFKYDVNGSLIDKATVCGIE